MFGKMKNKVMPCMVLALMMVMVLGVGTFAATVGQSLTSPESGWTRLDDTDSMFTYTGTWNTWSNPSLYGGSFNYTDSSNSQVTFSFTGTGLRIIGGNTTDNSANDYQLTIDGNIYTSGAYADPAIYQALIFDLQNLSNIHHTVTINKSTTASTSSNIRFDAVDIYVPVLQSITDGWTRLDDNNSIFNYTGTWSTDTWAGSNGAYNGGFHVSSDYSANCSFSFLGTGLKVLLVYGTGTDTNSMTINVDGTNYLAGLYNSPGLGQVLALELNGLPYNTHNISIRKTDDNTKYVTIDAIEFYVPITEPTPTGIWSSNKVNLSWTSVSGVTSYNVKRGIASGTYTTIASNITNTTYEDTTAQNGETYYYVVSAVGAAGESPNSNEVTMALLGNRAILEITMANGKIREYDMTIAQIDAFLAWYDNRANGTGKSYYSIRKTSNVKPFLGRRDYIVFDKILDFEVKDYNEEV